ncbi:hypothetical protein M422DRAFT_268967 [Sphaerobolus stellatus SS14]|uniref:Uncharacterized protein n=1 Tax=Sphaerobolus stellatus (strain SS14) TaxID=990650 RepID=A0A0C9ULC4_SPHS4|nr:hypothetical protein M422DRAFT_268967 [Sphaerobolus stellatus SS14]
MGYPLRLSQDAQRSYDKFNLARLTSENKNAENKLFSEIVKDSGIIGREITNSEALIKQYEKERDDLHNGHQKPQDKALEGLAESMGIPKALPDPTLAPPPAQKPLEDFFTLITAELSLSSETTATQTSTSTFSAGATASWGNASVSASVDHFEAHTSAMKELVGSNVKVSFECMHVDITRPWLRPELFYDEDLVLGPGIKISPGFTRLRELMESQVPNAQSELAMHGTFPLYPTAFLVTCNVVLEISESTSSLQTYMNSSNTSVSLSVSYSPFSANASGSHSSSNASSNCQTTASGCRIEIKAPQIIGWISQMVPALPRISQPAQPNAVVPTTQTSAYLGGPLRSLSLSCIYIVERVESSPDELYGEEKPSEGETYRFLEEKHDGKMLRYTHYSRHIDYIVQPNFDLFPWHGSSGAPALKMLKE